MSLGALIALLGVVVALVGLGLSMAWGPKLAYERHRELCESIPWGTSAVESRRRLVDEGLFVDNQDEPPRDNSPPTITGTRIVWFFYLSCDGQFSEDSYLQATEASGFCD